MRKIDVHQVDSFTNQLFGGNPAGVVTNADGLTDEEMQKIAREMNLSETAFVLKSASEQADLRLRFFTPTGDEIDFCGHATVGALFQLATLNQFGLGEPGGNSVRVETKAGILPMTVVSKEAGPSINYVAPKLDMTPYRLQGKAFAEAFGVPAELLKSDGTILLDKHLNYIYIPTASLKALGDQKFDFDRIRTQFGKENIIVFCFFAGETIEVDSDLHARGLAPNVGVDEDPFTGSMQAGLMMTARQNGYISPDKYSIITEQGHFVGRPGSARISQDRADGEFSITASAVSVFSTKMELR